MYTEPTESPIWSQTALKSISVFFTITKNVPTTELNLYN